MENKENYLTLDLEMNQSSGKIIQIGAVVGNIYTGAILEKLSVFINPGEPLNPDIIKLTGITEEQVQNEGVSLREGYNRLALMHKRHDCYCNPVTWGGGDSIELKEQLNTQWDEARAVQRAAIVLAARGFHGGVRYERTPEGLAQLSVTDVMLEEAKSMFAECHKADEADTSSFVFGRRWIDAKTLYVSYCIENRLKLQAGLKKACSKIGVTFEGPAHNALQDALNTFKIYRHLLRYFKEKPLSKGAADFAKSQGAEA